MLNIFQALEFQYEHSKQLYLTFTSTESRDSFYYNLLNHPKVTAEKYDSSLMTLKWQNGALSNYEYLCYLNRYLLLLLVICFI